MISGFWPIVVLLVTSVAATKQLGSPESSPISRASSPSPESVSLSSGPAQDNISAGGLGSGGGAIRIAPTVGSSLSLAAAASSSSPAAAQATASAPLNTDTDTDAIESEAQDLNNNNNSYEKNDRNKKLGAAATKRKSESAEVIAEKEEEPVIAQVTERLLSPNEPRKEQQVNISAGFQQQQSSERGQQTTSWISSSGQLNARLKSRDAKPIAQVRGGGGGGEDEKVRPQQELNHDHHDHHHHHQRQHHEASNPELQVTTTRTPSHEGRLTSSRKPSQISQTNRGKGPVVYTNQFVIEVEGGEEEAKKLAAKHGFVYLNHILADFYHLEHRRLSKRSLNAEQDLEDISIRDEPQVLLLERQVLKRRVKRDFIEIEPPPASSRLGRAYSQVRPPNQPRPPPSQQLLRPSALAGGRNYAHPPQQQLVTRPANQPAAPHHRLSSSSSSSSQLSTSPATPQRISADQLDHSPDGSPLDSLEVSASTPSVNLGTSFNNRQNGASQGPNQQSRIYLNVSSQSPSLSSSSSIQSPLKSTTVIAASNRTANSSRSNNNTSIDQRRPFNDPSWPLMWYLDGGAKNGFDLNVMAAWKMGYTGKGIVITILDDGLEKDHPDLQANYDPLASFDINGDDADPMPRYDVNDSNRHGTRCAGEVAAVPDNNICSIGIAYNSKVGGVRMLDGDVTDAVEARSLALNNQHIHIYSASWGPDDNGKTVDGPGELATRAFVEGVTYGRQGLGSIFVFASGNGGREHDNCNCDGYTNSIWTLSISSATENGYVPWYIEACSSTLATTYSSGSYEERQIATTDLHHSCTSSHTGTSASAPLAAGICALVLESNPRLTWRDMQHIVVRTAKPANLVAKDWRTNALGRNVSHAFGYGLMDAAAMILMAKQWTRMPDQYTCGIKAPPMEKNIPSRGFIELKLSAQCLNVSYLEHVQSKVTLSASRRGDLHIYLVSPGGTRSTLLAQRPNDHAEQGFRNWPFMTVHNWGESPNGIWTLEIHNDGKPQGRAFLKEWELILYGTKEDPNKHLDPIMSASGPSNLAPHIEQPANKQVRPSPGSQPASSTAPPPPISMTSQPRLVVPAVTEPTGAGRPSSSVSSSPTGGHQFWSTFSPSTSLPPPLPPLAVGRVPSEPPFQSGPTPSTSGTSTTSSSTSSSSSSATTQASYVTTFNTLVSGSSVARPSQPSSSSSVGVKADFDIVSPASERPIATNDANLGPAKSEPSGSTGQQTSITQPPAGCDTPDEPNITKPSIDSIEDQSQSTQTHNQHSSSSSGWPTTTSTTATTNGLDLEGGAGNQIDLKMSKDYRSSGDQSSVGHFGPVVQTAPTQTDHQQSDRLQNKQKASSSSRSSMQPGMTIALTTVLPALLSALIMHQQLKQLVRPISINNVI